MSSIKRTFTVAALVAIAVSLLSVSLALGASKVFDFKVQNVAFPPFPVGDACPPPGTDLLSGKFSGHFVLWDNGHKEFKVSIIGTLTDLATGAKTGHFNETDHFAVEVSGFPVNLQINAVVTCEGTGQIANIHFGFTIDENGNFHIHS